MNVRDEAIESLMEQERKESQRLWDEARVVRLDAGFYSPMISPARREELIQAEIQRLHPNLDPNDPARMPPQPPRSPSTLRLVGELMSSILRLLWGIISSFPMLIKRRVIRSR